MKVALIAGLAALTLASYACVPEYRSNGTVFCEKYGDRISAKIGNQIATKEDNFNYETRITYSKGMSMDQALKAIGACEKEFARKADKEQ